MSGLHPEDRRARTWRLAAIELPLVRACGSLLLIVGAYINNRYLAGATMRGWLLAAIVVAAYAIGSWLAVVFFLRRDRPRDLTVLTFAGDLVVWTFVIYQTGAEAS